MSFDAAIPVKKPRMEENPCPCCGGRDAGFFAEAEDDLTGKPGRFRFVRCHGCDLVYQRPRIVLEDIGAYYDNEYIAHRKKTDWGVFTPLYTWGMEGHDRRKVDAMISDIYPDGVGRIGAELTAAHLARGTSGSVDDFLAGLLNLHGESIGQIAAALRWEDFLLLTLKTLAYGSLLSLIVCYHGLAQPMRIEEVSRATTRTVAQAVVGCVFMDGLFIVLYLLL